MVNTGMTDAGKVMNEIELSVKQKRDGAE